MKSKAFTETIDFNGVKKCYGKKVALQDFSLSINKGEIFALLGLNGAGKTTAIKALLGLVKLQGGNISIFSESLNYSDLGFVPEQPDFSEFLTVNELLHHSLSLYRLLPAKEAQSHVDRVVELFDLSAIRHEPLSQLSKGNKQKASLASGVVHNPKLIIFDEPASGLDPMARVTVKAAIKKLNQGGATVIFTTHILADITGLCHRMGVVHQGQLVFCDTPTQLSQQGQQGQQDPAPDLESALVQLLSQEKLEPVSWVDLSKKSTKKMGYKGLNLRQALLAAMVILKGALRSNLALGSILLMLPFIWASWAFEQANPGFQTGFIVDMGSIFLSAFSVLLSVALALEHLYWPRAGHTPYFHLSRMSTTTYLFSRFIGVLGVVAPATLTLAAILMGFMYFTTGTLVIYPLLIGVSVASQTILSLALLSLLACFAPRLASLALLLIFFVLGMELETVRAFAESLNVGIVEFLSEVALVFLPDFSILTFQSASAYNLLASLCYSAFQGLFYLFLGGQILASRDL
jgi:ABC-2 type transport system ATP-binding protein